MDELKVMCRTLRSEMCRLSQVDIDTEKICRNFEAESSDFIHIFENLKERMECKENSLTKYQTKRKNLEQENTKLIVIMDTKNKELAVLKHTLTWVRNNKLEKEAECKKYSIKYKPSHNDEELLEITEKRLMAIKKLVNIKWNVHGSRFEYIKGYVFNPKQCFLKHFDFRKDDPLLINNLWDLINKASCNSHVRCSTDE